MERNLVDVSAIPEKPNQTLNLDDDAEMFEDFKFLGGATLLEGPSFLHSNVQEEAKTSCDLETLNQNLAKMNREMEELKRLFL
jgi:hypothetical protein